MIDALARLKRCFGWTHRAQPNSQRQLDTFLSGPCCGNGCLAASPEWESRPYWWAGLAGNLQKQTRRREEEQSSWCLEHNSELRRSSVGGGGNFWLGSLFAICFFFFLLYSKRCLKHCPSFLKSGTYSCVILKQGHGTIKGRAGSHHYSIIYHFIQWRSFICEKTKAFWQQVCSLL